MHWQAISVPDSKQVDHLQESLSVPLIIAYLLAQRGIQSYDEAKTFFRPNWNHLHDPFLMQDMQLAVERIHQAIEA